MNERYAPLFEPLRIGGITVRNRIMQSGHDKRYAWRGSYNQREVDYQEARAAGGAALLVTGSRIVHPTGAYSRSRLGWDRDGLPGDRAVVAAVHRHGAAIFAQLGHMGSMAQSDAVDDLRILWAPSEHRTASGETARAMDRRDIDEVVAAFAESAAVAVEGSFDGVELHFAHSYLVHQFISPLFNRRDDEFGGSLENRLRFGHMIIEAVRDAVPDGYVVGLRLGVNDFDPRGLTVEEGAEVAAAYAATGLVDYLSVSGGGTEKGLLIAPGDVPRGWMVDMAAAVKRKVGDLPVFAVGGIGDAETALRVVTSGAADMVAMTRAQIADPDLVTKIESGRPETINRCIRANQGCIAQMAHKGVITCTVNPTAGREGVIGPATVRPATSPQRWVVVGGGPAGMKAAVTLRSRGHEVVLLERSHRLGGAVNLAAATPGRSEFAWLVEDLSGELDRFGVDVRLGVGASVDEVASLQPDRVIVATGARADMSGRSWAAAGSEALDGVDLPHVIDLRAAIEHPEQVGETVVVLDDDGTRRVAGVAELLADSGRRVVIISHFASLMSGSQATLDMAMVHRRLAEKGVVVHSYSTASRLTADTVDMVHLHTGEHRAIPAESVVLAAPPLADSGLAHDLERAGWSVQRIGDCAAPRRIDHAIYEGYLAGIERLDQGRYFDEGRLEGSAPWTPAQHVDITHP